MSEEVKVEEVKAEEPKKKKPKNYINNADLLIEISKSRQTGKMTDKLAHMLMMLCQRYAKHSDYSRIYSYEEDMQAFALLTLVKVWPSFNPEKSQNPFAYFTQIIRHAFYQYLNHEKKQREVKDEMLIDIGETPSFTYMENYNEKPDDGGDIGEVREIKDPDSSGKYEDWSGNDDTMEREDNFNSADDIKNYDPDSGEYNPDGDE